MTPTQPLLPFTLKDPSLLIEGSYIDGEPTQAKSGQTFQVVDPGSDKPWATCPDSGPEDVDGAIQSAARAFQTYKTLNPRKRAQLILAWHQSIIAARDDLATLLTYETGKPIPESQAELDMALGFSWFFVGEAERINGSVITPSVPNRRTLSIKQPLGVVAALVPWNYPVAMILRKLAAAFAAGCTVVVKPSPETPLTCTALASLASRAGFGAGVFNVLTTSNENTPSLSEAMIAHPLVRKVTFTGSTRVGRIVASMCAQHLKKCSLELGGNSPFIVFEDADLEQAADVLAGLKWKHAGQSCISANRVYVQAGVYDRFADLLVRRGRALKVGHASDPDSTMGPVTTPRSLNKIQGLVSDALARGAKLVLGSGKPYPGASEQEGSGQGKGVGGYFMDPTVLTGMTQESRISKEEIFGPVAALFKFETEEQVLQWANDTSMGLASYAFSKNVDRMWRVYENLEAGIIGFNTGSSTSAEIPFGGIKDSGYGKEGGKELGVDEYLYTKTGTLTLSGHY